jgi:cytochrome P450
LSLAGRRRRVKDGLDRSLKQSCLLMPVAPQFDLAGPAYFADPHAALRQLREAAPVWFSPRLRRWIVTRWDDVTAILRDPQRFSSRVVPELPAAERGGPLAEFERLSARWLFFLDPPEHAGPRRGLAQALGNVTTHVPDAQIEDWAAELLDDALASQRDLIAGLAHPLAARVMGSVLCPGELPAFLELCRQMEAASRTPHDALARQAGLAAIAGVTALVSRLAAQAGTGVCPVIDALVAAEGAAGPPRESLAGQALVLVFAGVETTQNLIGNLLAALAANPSERATLIERPDLVPQAVEEGLRFDPPVLGVVRQATEDVTVGGQRIAAGDQLADVFDIQRPPGGHLAFGGGIHHCAGAAWARQTAEQALRVCLRALPHWHFEEAAWRSHDPLVRGLIALRLV